MTEKRIVLLIDEVDSASNNQVFIDFLAQLRQYYLMRKKVSTFHSVILAGVYDVRNIKQKIRPDEEHKVNSPWNTRDGDCPRDQMVYTPFDIAADFDVEMNFSVKDIRGMLEKYEADYHTGMNIDEISGLLFEYTSGYPYLVSRLCKIHDEKMKAHKECLHKGSTWTKEGFLEAVKQILSEKSPLFESLTEKLSDNPELKNIIYRLLFQGQTIAYNVDEFSYIAGSTKW